MEVRRHDRIVQSATEQIEENCSFASVTVLAGVYLFVLLVKLRGRGGVLHPEQAVDLVWYQLLVVEHNVVEHSLAFKSHVANAKAIAVGFGLDHGSQSEDVLLLQLATLGQQWAQYRIGILVGVDHPGYRFRTGALTNTFVSAEAHDS